MDTSSSDELTSDEELEKIIDSVWIKTKLSFDKTEIVSEGEDRHAKEQTANDSEQETDLSMSQLFVVDKKSHLKKTVPIKKMKVKNTSENSSQSDSSESHREINDSSLFVVDKQPSLLNNVKALSETNNQEHEKKQKQQKNVENNQSLGRKFEKTYQSLELSSSLKAKWDPSNIYINLHSKHAPLPKHGTPNERMRKEVEEIMKKSVVTPDFEKKEAVPSTEESRKQRQKQRKQEREKTKGRGWFNMPIGELTEETKKDLIALKMRRALDPKRFYKGDDIKGMPKYFQFGTVVEDATEFYSARVPKKQRKKSMVEEIMADAEFRKFNKRKYSEIQDLKSKGLGPYQGVRTLKTKKKKKK